MPGSRHILPIFGLHAGRSHFVALGCQLVDKNPCVANSLIVHVVIRAHVLVRKTIPDLLDDAAVGVVGLDDVGHILHRAVEQRVLGWRSCRLGRALLEPQPAPWLAWRSKEPAMSSGMRALKGTLPVPRRRAGGLVLLGLVKLVLGFAVEMSAFLLEHLLTKLVAIFIAI